MLLRPRNRVRASLHRRNAGGEAMSDTRRKDVSWTIPEGNELTWQAAQTAVLMDIRDELKRLNGLLHCSNFIAIPTILRGVRRNTAKPRKPARRVRRRKR
jgi:hypothetical protein